MQRNQSEHDAASLPAQLEIETHCGLCGSDDELIPFGKFHKQCVKILETGALPAPPSDEPVFCEHGYPLEGPPWPPCGCRPVVCAICRRQMFYDGDSRHEPELSLRKSNDLTSERYAHDACVFKSVAATPPLPTEAPPMLKYRMFASRCDAASEPQQFASVELLHQEDDQMIEEIVALLNKSSFRDCVITWTGEKGNYE